VQWTCSRCGRVHEGQPRDWAFDAPDYWHTLSPAERSRGKLSEDLCVIRDDDGEHFFIRGVLPIPVAGSDDEFRYGVWTTLSETSFMRVLELWDDPKRSEEPPYFGWLSNRISGYPETLNLKTNVRTAALDLRPTIDLQPTDHPLALEQRDGMTTERLQEIVELRFHESRRSANESEDTSDA
jgi:hypothetical protein